MRSLAIIAFGIFTTANVPAVEPKPLPDADALAKRLPFEQDTYRQACDEALAAFSARHTSTHSYDAEARQLLKLEVYLAIWGDYYEEGLGPLAADHAMSLQRGEGQDPLWQFIIAQSSFAHRHSVFDDDAHKLNLVASDFGSTPYPALLKLAGFDAAIKNLIAVKTDYHAPAAVARCLGEMPELLRNTGSAFSDLVKAHPSHLTLYRVGHELLHTAQKDEPTLQAIHAAFDDAFAQNDPGNVQASVLDGEFEIQDAWNARGTGYADTVTPDGSSLFNQRLAQARKTLEEAAMRSPKEPGVALSMMTVCLGEGQPLEALDTWYQRGQQVEGDPYVLAFSKANYLQPKWYGSDDAAWEFGLECAKSANWAGKVPLVLEDSLHERAVRQTSIFTQAEIWEPLEQMFRGYLAHYPDSVHYRSLFALEASFGGHWDVAKEQFTLLGDSWDPRICGEETHQKMKSQALGH